MNPASKYGYGRTGLLMSLFGIAGLGSGMKKQHVMGQGTWYGVPHPAIEDKAKEKRERRRERNLRNAARDEVGRSAALRSLKRQVDLEHNISRAGYRRMFGRSWEI